LGRIFILFSLVFYIFGRVTKAKSIDRVLISRVVASLRERGNRAPKFQTPKLPRQALEPYTERWSGNGNDVEKCLGHPLGWEKRNN
jgi:hypothetical protein